MPIFKVDASVPDRVSVLLEVNVLPFAIVSVDAVAGAVSATLLMLVAEATPKDGVVSVGEVLNTNAPDPVSSLITPASCAEVVAANCASVPLVAALLVSVG